jgi:two-component system sensor histidine kinase BaeS
MSRVRALGLAPRMAVAMAAVALLSVGIATVVVNRGLEGRLEDFARERLSTSAKHAAELAAELYRRDDRWTRAALSELGHLAEAGEFRLELRDADGRRLAGSQRVAAGPDAVRAPVRVRGRPVGEVRVAPRTALLLPRDRELQDRLDGLHLVSAVLALSLGLGAALFLAASLARPLRRLTASARRIELGRLGERAPASGGGEINLLAQALNRLAETLEREDELRRDAVADVAHELRTPVSGILSRIEAAQDGVLTDARGNLDAMHAETRRLATLIADLERLADAERPGLTLRKRRLDLAALAGERAQAFAERFAAAGIRLEQRLDPVDVHGDAARLEQVVDNLLSNALHYTERQGSVRLTAGREGSEAVLEIADTGIGIEPEDLEHVFERFWRADRSRSRATGGAGIGLAIVRELVRAHDGRVEVESAPGKGALFRVTLPPAEKSPVRVARQHHAAPGARLEEAAQPVAPPSGS